MWCLSSQPGPTCWLQCPSSAYVCEDNVYRPWEFSWNSYISVALADARSTSYNGERREYAQQHPLLPTPIFSLVRSWWSRKGRTWPQEFTVIPHLLVWSRCKPPFIKEMGGEVWGRGAARRYCLHWLKENHHLHTLPPCIWVTIMWGRGSWIVTWSCTLKRSISDTYVFPEYKQQMSSVSHCFHPENLQHPATWTAYIFLAPVTANPTLSYL